MIGLGNKEAKVERALVMNHPDPGALGEATPVDASSVGLSGVYRVTLNKPQEIAQMAPFQFSVDLGGAKTFVIVSSATDPIMQVGNGQFTATLVHEAFHRCQNDTFKGDQGDQDVENLEHWLGAAGNIRASRCHPGRTAVASVPPSSARVALAGSVRGEHAGGGRVRDRRGHPRGVRRAYRQIARADGRHRPDCGRHQRRLGLVDPGNGRAVRDRDRHVPTGPRLAAEVLVAGCRVLHAPSIGVTGDDRLGADVNSTRSNRVRSVVSFVTDCRPEMSRTRRVRGCSMLGFMTESSLEPEIVGVARDVRAVRRSPADFDAAFAVATVFARRTRGQRPGVMVSMLPGKGQWVLAFSTPERLAAFGQDTPWMSLADLLVRLPAGIGVLLDVGEDHGLPLLPQPDGPARFAGARLPGTDPRRPRSE